MTELPRSLTDILRNLPVTDDVDVAFISAAAINLYIENMRRVHGRALLVPQDAVNIFHMIEMMLTPVNPTATPKKDVRDRKLTEAEEKQLLGAIEPELPAIGRRV